MLNGTILLFSLKLNCLAIHVIPWEIVSTSKTILIVKSILSFQDELVNLIFIFLVQNMS